MTPHREPIDVASHGEVAPPQEPIPQMDPYPNAGGALFAHIPRSVPHLGHTAIFGAIVVIAMLGVMLAVGLGGTLHVLGAPSFERIQKNPMVVVPTMGVAYLLVWAVSWFFFPLMWFRPFLDGISWNRGVASRRWALLLAIGLGLGLVVQFLSNFLPIPKTLPIDDFFKTRASVWIVTIFGILFAPAFEELAFRGFLLPSLATAWDWLAHRIQQQPQRRIDPVSGQAQWSLAAMVFAAIATSIPFALLHAEQLAHAFAPLAVLFGVSLVLCIVRFRTSSLAASILVHASYNLSIFGTLFLATNGFRNLDKLHG